MENDPVLVDIRQDKIMVQQLANTPDGPALVEGMRHMHIGNVKKYTSRDEKGAYRTGWRWWDVAGGRGESTTKEQAIIHMLSFSGFREVTLNDTIPSLFDLD